MRALSPGGGARIEGAGPGPDRAASARRPGTLSLATLRRLPLAVSRPAFDPSALRCGILHLGCGSFHRAHQAFLTQKAIEAEHGAVRTWPAGAPPAWGIVGVSLRTPTVVRGLQAQDGLFSVLEYAGASSRAVVVGTMRHLIHAPTQPAALRHALADPAVRIVTLTVTVGGYCTHAGTGRLDAGDPAVRRDLERPNEPCSAIGVLVEGLRRRRAAGTPPPVILSCDNVPGNGRLLRQMCLDHAALQDDELATWIGRHVQFPCTMVDRIVPASTASDRQCAAAALGVADAMTVPAEPFHQWVIERFEGPRPRWDAAGAEYVGDVAPWEASKLRLLNGGHLAVACLGLLAGCATIAETMDLPGLEDYALRFMRHEQKPTLPPSDHDIDAYSRQLIVRWRNHGIAHQLSRVTRDSAAKLPMRLLASLRDNLHARRPAPCTVLGVAAWMCCAFGVDETGRTFSMEDPVMTRLQPRVSATAPGPARLVDLMLDMSEIFGGDLAAAPGLRSSLVHAVALLRQRGVRAAVAACIGGERIDSRELEGSV